MENLGNSEFKSLEEVNAAIQSGGDFGRQVAERLVAKEFINLPEYAQIEEPQEFVPEEPVVEGIDAIGGASELPEEQITDDGEQEPQDNSWLAQRELYDAFAERENKLKADLERQLQEQEARMAREKEEFQKQLEELMKNNVINNATEGDDFSEYYDGEVQEEVVSIVAEATKDGSELSPEVLRRIEMLERRDREREEDMAFNKAVDQYNNFWHTERGKHLRPEGNPRDNVNTFLTFYDNLVRKLGNDTMAESRANRLMQDIAVRNMSSARTDVEGMGIEIPNEFDKLFRSYEVELFSNGQRIDKITGSVDKVHNNRHSFEDAYVLLYKDEPLINAKKEAIQSVQKKLSQRTNTAQVNPEEYAAHPTKSVYSDLSHNEQLLKACQRAGLKGLDPRTIKDPTLQEKFKEWKAHNGM